MSILKKFIKFCCASAENKTQVYLFAGFVIIPIIGMSALYIWVRVFWL